MAVPDANMLPNAAKRPRPGDGDPDEGEQGNMEVDWTLSISKAYQRKVEKEVERVAGQQNRNGLFTVVLKRKAAGEAEAPKFEAGSGLRMSEDIRSVVEESQIRLYEDCIKVAVDSITAVDRLLGITKLGVVDVVASCKGVTDSWTSITDVDPWISSEEIRGALINEGLLEAKRVTYRRGDKVITSRKVLLKFKGIPPESVILARRVHEVTVDYGRPLRCFKCQRLGHKSAFCRSEAAHCIKCGKAGHVIKDCKEEARCVSCKGSHMATFANCPVTLAVKEKRREFCEQKLQKQVQAKYSSAGIVEFPQLEDSSSKTPAAQTGLSYAKVTSRKLVAQDAEGKQVTVNLGATRKVVNTPAASKGSASRPRFPTYRRRTVAKKGSKKVSALGGIDVASLLGLLRLLSPELISLLQTIITQLGGTTSKAL